MEAMAVIVGGAAEERQEGGNLILWILVWSELVAFGVLLAGFMITSVLDPESFGAGKLQLDGRLASLNTLVLIASGWLAAEAARAATERVRRLSLVGAAMLGFVFAAVKLLEYRHESAFFGEAAYGAFFELYLLITGFHLAHVMFLAVVMLILARRPDRGNVGLVTTLWHIVDIVWLVIFPVVYLG
jgi:nitric oxide reductase NorE protein